MKKGILKYAVFSLLIGLSIAACTSKTDVVPAVDAGNLIAGVYPLTFVEGDSASVTLYKFNLPYTVGTNSLSGTLTARRDSASVIFLTQLIKQTGYADQSSVLGTFQVKPSAATTSSYDLFQGGQKVGTADGTSLNLDELQTDPATGTTYRTIVTGKK